MEMKTYILTATSNLYKTTYILKAKDLSDASRKAKIKFAKDFKVFGNNVKIGLDISDVKNHIEEIMDKLYIGE